MSKTKVFLCFVLVVAIAGLSFGQPAPEKKIIKMTRAPKPGGLPFLYGMTATQKEEILSQMSGMAMIQLAKKAGLTAIRGKDITQYPKLTKSAANRMTLTDSPVATDPSYYENEPSIAVRPTSLNIIALACHHYAGSGPVDIVVYTSFNSGSTWSGPHFVPKRYPTDTLSDPVIRYAPNGKYLYASYMSIRADASNADIMVTRSTNNGLTWQAPKVAIPGADYDGDGKIDVPDKPWLDVHPFPNSSAANPMVYVTSTLFLGTGATNIAFVRSYNYATSFSGGIWRLSYADNRLMQGSRPIGGLNGDVFVSFYDAGDDGWGPGNSLNPPYSGGGVFDINAVRFSNYGATLSNWEFAAKDVSYELPYYLGPADPVTGNGKYHRWWGGMFPSVAMLPNGTVFIVFTADDVDPSVDPFNPECGQIYITRSFPPYTQWIPFSGPISGNSPGHGHGYPTIGVKKITGNAIITLAWEDHGASQIDNELYDINAIKHIDSILPPIFPLVVSDFSSYSDYLFIGDYIDCGASAKVTTNVTDRVIYIVWTDRSDQTTTSGESDVWADMVELFY